jgi:hypothetical protein
MQEFENYVKSNYNIPNAASCGITYTHSKSSKLDKKSNRPVIVHTINMKLVWFDSSNHQLDTSKLAFQNDTLTKPSEKVLRTINPSDTTNKFRAAKNEIVQTLIHIRQQAEAKLQDEIQSLHSYLGNNNTIIPQSMKPHIELGLDHQRFDM